MGFCEFMFLSTSISIFAALIGAICGEAEGKREERERREHFRRARHERLNRRTAEYNEYSEILRALPDNQQVC